MAVRIDAGRGGQASVRSEGLRVRGPTAGQSMAEIGRTLANFAEPQLDKMRLERAQEEEAADRIEIARRGSEARLEWQERLSEALEGYDGSEPGFAERTASLFRADAQERLKDLNPRVRDALELDLVQFGERLTSSAIEGERAKRQTFVMRGLRETLDNEAMSLMAAPDDLHGAMMSVQKLAEAAPEGLRKEFISDSQKVLIEAYSDALLREDPGRLAMELQDGLFDHLLDAPQKKTLTATADGALKREVAALERQQEQARTEAENRAKSLVSRVVAYENAGLPAPTQLIQAAQEAALALDDQASIEKIALARYKRQRKGKESSNDRAKDALDALEDAFEEGLVPSNEMIATARAEVEAAGSEKLVERLIQIGETQGIRQDAAFMDRDALDERMTELRQGTVGEAELREFKVLSGVADQRARRGATDNIGWAIDNGLPLATIGLASETLVGDVAVRVEQARALAQQTGERLQIFSKQERQAILGDFDQLKATDQAVVLAKLTSGAGAHASSLIRELAEKRPELGQIGYLTATGRGDIALEALQGAEFLKSNKDLLPSSKTELTDIEQRVIGTAIPVARQDIRTAIVQTARNAYAAELAKAGKTSDDFDRDDYEAMVQRAAGEQNGQGGIGTVNGVKVQLPAHMRATQMRRILKSMTAEDWAAFSLSGESAPAVLAGSGGSQLDADELESALQDGGASIALSSERARAALSGVNLEPLSVDELKRVFPISVGEGRYQISLTDPRHGAQYVLDGESDPTDPRPFVLDLTQVNPDAIGQRTDVDAALERARQKTRQAQVRDEQSIASQRGRGYAIFEEHQRRLSEESANDVEE